MDELEKVWKRIRKTSGILIGGWATHLLLDKRFFEWKGIHYIGSKDIDFCIRTNDLENMSEILCDMDYTPLNFRFYKIFDRDTKKNIAKETAARKPIFELFYLYVDIILDEKLGTEKKGTFFHDPLLKFCMDNKLYSKIDDFLVLRPEPLVLSKLRCAKERVSDKRIKDILDVLLLTNLVELDKQLFSELSDLYSFDKSFIANIINEADGELSNLRMNTDEIRNIKTTFLSFIEV